MTHWVVCCVCCASALTFFVVLCVFENFYLALSAVRCTTEILKSLFTLLARCQLAFEFTVYHDYRAHFSESLPGFERTEVQGCLAIVGACIYVWCVAVCWSVLQWGVVCSSVLQWGAGVSRRSRCAHLYLMCCSVLQCVTVCCGVLQFVAVCCSVLQQCLAIIDARTWIWCVAECCSALQCVAVCCRVL